MTPRPALPEHALPERFSIRPATVDDVDAVVGLFDAVAAEQIWIGTEAGFDRDERAAGIRAAYLEPSTYTAFVVVERPGAEPADGSGSGGRVVVGAPVGGARVVGALGLSTPSTGVAELSMLLLDGYRGRGLGSALMTAGVARAREAGMHKITLQMWPHNVRGRALYEKFGFVDEGRLVRHYLRRNGELWDAIVMGLVLDHDRPGSSIPE